MALTTESISAMDAPQLSNVHAHIHRLFKASNEKSVLASLHTSVVSALLSHDIAHSTPLTHTPSGLYLKHPHSRLIYDGKKTLIAQPSPIPITGTHILISKESGFGRAYGLVTIAPPDTIESDQFDSQFKLHRVTTKEREKWWSKCKSLLLYPITSFTPYPDPLPVEVPAGVQMIMPEVKFIDIESDKQVESSEEEQPMPSDIATKKDMETKEHSYSERSMLIRFQWNQMFKPRNVLTMYDEVAYDDQPWLGEIYDDKVVFSKDNEWFVQDYTMADDHTVTFGEPQKVEKEWKPVGDKEKNIEGEPEPDSQEKSTDSAEVEVNSTQDFTPAGVTTGADKESEREIETSADTDDVEVTPTNLVETPTSQLNQLNLSQPRKSILDRCIATIKDIVGWEDKPDTPSHLPFVFKSKDGTKSYFLIWPTNSYVDRDNPPEAFRATALHDFVDSMDSKAIKSELQFWHLKQTKFGDIIWQDVIEDRFLAQVGVFDDTPIGDAFKQFFTEYPNGHPVIAPEGWGASHGFTYKSGDRQDGIYDWLHTDESTVLPLRYAANLLNPSPIALGGKEMDDKRREALQKIGEDVGLDLVAYIEATAKTARELADDKVEHKMTKDEKKEDIAEVTVEETEDVNPDEKEVTEDAKSATEVQDTETPAAIDMDALVAAFVEQAGLKELSTAFAALTARMDKLEEADEKETEEKTEEEMPRYPFSWLQNSKDESTILTEDEEEEFADKKPEEKQRGASTTDAGQLINRLISNT